MFTWNFFFFFLEGVFRKHLLTVPTYYGLVHLAFFYLINGLVLWKPVWVHGTESEQFHEVTAQVVVLHLQCINKPEKIKNCSKIDKNSYIESVTTPQCCGAKAAHFLGGAAPKERLRLQLGECLNKKICWMKFIDDNQLNRDWKWLKERNNLIVKKL